MKAYYNEIDQDNAQWLRNLIAAGEIAKGDVDDRSIEEVEPSDLVGYSQCHFFAGVGIWSRALRLAGWGDDEPVWTGSAPCQPFSAAGKRKGFEDRRHLYPAWSRLIREHRPVVVLGEQVASKDGEAWLDLVQADMEEMGYAFGPVVLPAAGFGAPHGRHRLYFVADAERGAPERHGLEMGAAPGRDQGEGHQRQRLRPEPRDGGIAGELVYTDHQGPQRRGECPGTGAGECPARPSSPAFGMAYADGGIESDRGIQRSREHGLQPEDGGLADGDQGAGAVNGFWRVADWVHCRDSKWRPVESGTFPLAHGDPARVGRLRAYGNAIVAEVAAEFIKAYMSCR